MPKEGSLNLLFQDFWIADEEEYLKFMVLFI